MKAELDKHITENYDKLIRIAQSKVTYFDVDIKPEVILADAYIYVLGKLPLSKADIPKYLVNYMNIELMYPQSRVRRRERICDNVQIDESIEGEIQYLTFDEEQVLHDFKSTLGRIEQIIWEVYFDKGKRTSREFSDHIGVPHTTGYLALNEVLVKFKKYYKRYEN